MRVGRPFKAGIKGPTLGPSLREDGSAAERPMRVGRPFKAGIKGPTPTHRRVATVDLSPFASRSYPSTRRDL